MRIRGLVIALGVLALLGGGVYWSERVKKAEEGKPPADAPPDVLKIPEDQFQRIELRKKGGEPIVLQKSASGQWEMLSGEKWPVDQDSAGGIVSTLANLASSRLVEEKAGDLAQFGLADPPMEVIVARKDGKTHRLLVGDDSPAGGGPFVKLEGDPRVFTIAAYNKAGFDRTARELRDKRLVKFEGDKLTRLEVTARGRTVEFGKNAQNEWQIVRPQPYRADGGLVEELVRKIGDARMDPFTTPEDDKKAAAAFAAGTLAGVARLTDAAGTHQIEVRRDKDKNCWARGSAIEGVHRVSSDLADSLDKNLDDFRNKRLFDFGYNDPSSVEVRDGGKQASYQKQTDRWMSGPTQMDASTVNALMDKLRDLAAVKFVTSAFPAPEFEAKVTWSGGQRSEKVLFGKQGAVTLAKRDGEPAVYEIDAKALDEIRQAFGAIKAYQPPKTDPKKK
jgi:hypothetical protein